VIRLPYCGAAPLPGELLARFNLDPWLIAALVAICALQCLAIRRHGAAARVRLTCALGGWAVAAAAFVSPICALSVALFSARIAQHMILILVAAPLVAMGLPRSGGAHYVARLWGSTGLLFAALWFWHMPTPYDATFASTGVYWAMHSTLFGSAILVWRELLDHPPRRSAHALTAAIFTFVQMGLLGAVLAFADRPLFLWHLTTTQAWGFAPLQDQQLGGAIMWVPGMVLFLWIGMRSVSRLWASLERARPA
jgi:putative membrane protein